MSDTSGTTGRPKGVIVTHSNVLSDINNFNYWMRYREGGVYLHAAPIFHIADFPAMFAAPMFGASQVTLGRFQPEAFCAVVAKERVNYTVLVPTMINLLTQFAESNPDFSSIVAFKLNGDAHLAAWVPAADVTAASANPASRTARSHLGDSLAGCVAKAEAFAPREELVIVQQANTLLRLAPTFVSATTVHFLGRAHISGRLP